jgi:hypothetical protein
MTEKLLLGDPHMDRICTTAININLLSLHFVTIVFNSIIIIFWLERCKKVDRFCSLVVRVPDCRSRGPGWITGVTRFSEN